MRLSCTFATSSPRISASERTSSSSSAERRAGHLDVDAHEQVAAAAAAQRGHAPALQPEHVTRLRARRDDELLEPFERLDVEVGAERRPA